MVEHSIPALEVVLICITISVKRGDNPCLCCWKVVDFDNLRANLFKSQAVGDI